MAKLHTLIMMQTIVAAATMTADSKKDVARENVTRYFLFMIMFLYIATETKWFFHTKIVLTVVNAIKYAHLVSFVTKEGVAPEALNPARIQHFATVFRFILTMIHLTAVDVAQNAEQANIAKQVTVPAAPPATNRMKRFATAKWFIHTMIVPTAGDVEINAKTAKNV